MELRRYFAILRRRIAVVLVTLAVALLFGWGATPRMPQYHADATVYVGAEQFLVDEQSTAFASDKVDTANRLLNTIAQMIDSEVTARSAIRQTGVDRDPETVVGETSVGVMPGTQLLQVNVLDRDREVATKLANGLATAFTTSTRSTTPGQPLGQGVFPAIPGHVFERATPATSALPTGLGHNLLLATLLGLAAGAAAAFLLDYLDVSVKDPSDIEDELDLRVLGMIPLDPGEEPPAQARNGRRTSTHA